MPSRLRFSCSIQSSDLAARRQCSASRPSTLRGQLAPIGRCLRSADTSAHERKRGGRLGQREISPLLRQPRALTSCIRLLALKFHRHESSGRISAARPFSVRSTYKRFPPRAGLSTFTGRKGREDMSNHFTGLSLGAPLGDFRLDLCDLFAFQSPSDPSRTVLIRRRMLSIRMLSIE